MSAQDINLNIAIIGAGFIGQKRAKNLPAGMITKVVCDIDKIKGETLAAELKCQYEKDWCRITKDKNIDVIFIATTHDMLATIATDAVKNNKHVLIEKPGGRNEFEIQTLITAHKKNPVVVAFGYNHRYHPAILKAKELINSNIFGPILFIRAKYGHGARLGYEKEWRFKKELSGGGELIDQGPHLIDLVNYFGVKMEDVKSQTGTVYWDTTLEDTAFVISNNKLGQLVNLSVSCVEWKNIFSFEIILKTAKIHIEGLGRSYGMEKLTLYTMKPEMGPPDVECFEYPEEDLSWKSENKNFYERILAKDYSDKSLVAAKDVLDIVSTIYNQNP